MKKISIVVPCYNEEENIEDVVSEVTCLFQKTLTNYDYEILFIDNCSTDKTQTVIEQICEHDKKVKAIFNAANFSYENSLIYGLTQSLGDCAVLIHADLQYPVDKIPEFINEWENGYKVVCGVKNNTHEEFPLSFFRSTFYTIFQKIATIRIIKQFTGFGLFDRNFIRIIEKVDDPVPIARGIIGEYAKTLKTVPFTIAKRKAGVSSAPFSKLYDIAWLNLTTYSKIAIRSALFIGITSVFLSFISLVFFLIEKNINWKLIQFDITIVLFAILLFGGIQLIILGILGEYIYTINQRVAKLRRPIVIEERRLNFE
jgi:glycosyltransferase involved in cell wall biosynthesis